MDPSLPASPLDLAAPKAAVRVLFADEDPAQLKRLRDGLTQRNARWEMVFVTSGASALAALGRVPFDVLVCSDDMPGSAGRSLIAEAHAYHPAVARLALCRPGDRQPDAHPFHHAHQVLGHPCEPDHLRDVVDRLGAFRALLRDDRLRSLVCSLDHLPTLPATGSELAAAVTRPDVTIEELVAIVEGDPALAVKLLQLVNSAWFGASRRTSSLSNAVAYLGIDLVGTLALSAGVFTSVDGTAACERALRGLQARSVAAARLVRCMLPSGPRAARGFTAGLLHEVGLLVLAAEPQARFQEIDDEARRSGRPRCEIERQRLGVTHAEVGACLLATWGLPSEVIEAVAWHHAPATAPRVGDVTLLAATYLASELVERAAAGQVHSVDGLDVPLLERAGLADRLGSIAEQAAHLVAEAA